MFPLPADAATTVGEFRVVSLAKLIELKLASGLSAEHRRLRDLADVQQLIETLNLSPDVALRLDNSVRDEYLRLWGLAQKTLHEETESGE